MKAANLVKIAKELLKMMSYCDLKVSDWQWLDLYSEYIKNKKMHVKQNANIFILSEKYKISESTVKRLIHRFEQDI